MFRNASTLEGSTINGTDGEIGHVEDVYFDDETWTIRYLVIDTGSWLTSRKVLISPHSVTQPLGTSRIIDALLTREQVKNSPEIDTHRPVSRQHEREYLGYYGYPTYWGAGLGPLSGYAMTPSAAPPDYAERHETREVEAKPEDAHLRSIRHVSGYHVEASDESIGHVDGFVFDGESWAIRYLIVDTRNWWPGGRKVLVATHWIDRIDWNERKVHTSLTRKAVKASPEYRESVAIDRQYEARLHEAYGREGYWMSLPP
jgi:sporulation protein YlmC with PRC-barrel domain